MKPILNPFAPEHRALLGEVLRFVVVGITAVALQYGVYALMLLVVNAFIANTIGYGVSFLFNFLASTRYTFKVKGSVRKGVGFALCHHRSPEFRACTARVKTLKQSGIAQIQRDL